MPKNIFLGIDCSGVMAELALITPANQEFILREDTSRQADVIFDMLKKLLGDAGIEPKNLTAIGAITGPGSFTGIRVGLALAQGLADGIAIPAYGLDAFMALGANQNAAIVLESKRAELYVQHDGKIEMLLPADILALHKTIIHNTKNEILGLRAETSMALAAANHAKTCAEKNIPGEILQPFYVRGADAKPSAP